MERLRIRLSAILRSVGNSIPSSNGSKHGKYVHAEIRQGLSFDRLVPGTFAFRLNVSGIREDDREINIPTDVVIMPQQSTQGDLPVLIEALRVNRQLKGLEVWL